MVADEAEYEAIVILDQSDVKLIKPQQPAKLCIDQYRDLVLQGYVLSSSRDELEVVPRELSQANGGPITIKPEAGEGKPLLKSFEVYLTIDSTKLSDSVQLGDGFCGNTKIKVGTASLGEMAIRYFRNLINFR